MRLIREQYKLRCDLMPCKNMAEYTILTDDNKRHNVHICKDCLRELYTLIAPEVTPKSVENVVRRAENRRNEWNNTEKKR